MLTHCAKALIKLYQIALSPWIGNQCRYHPTCSCYAHQAYEKFGFIRGTALALFRVCNCHPFSNRPWTDPVPERFAWKALIGYKQDTLKSNKPENENKVE